MDSSKEAIWRGWNFVFPSQSKEFATSYVERLFVYYSQEHRTYHSLEHIADVINLVIDCKTRLRSKRNVIWALIFHDAVYDPRSATNEADSVILAGQLGCELLASGVTDVPDLEETRRLIMLTCHSSPSPNQLMDPDGAVLIDADLSILGASPDRFARYDADIRIEYKHVPERAFIAGRSAVLHSFLARDRIFASDEFFERYEGQARHNLDSALAKLNLAPLISI